MMNVVCAVVTSSYWFPNECGVPPWVKCNSLFEQVVLKILGPSACDTPIENEF